MTTELAERTPKERTYKDTFTLDGRLRPQVGVSREKVLEARKLLEGALRGDRMADARLREAVTSSDAIVNLAHLMNLQFIPQLDKITHDVSGIAGTRSVPDFNPVVLWSIYLGNGVQSYDESDLKGPGLDANGAALRVPEGSPYPFVSLTGGIESFYQKLAKRGARFEFTWEARINDTISFFDALPGELLGLYDDTQWHELFDAILSATGTSALAGGALPNGVTVPANAKLSPYSIAQVQYEISQRKINGRFIGNISDWNLFVPIGKKRFWDFQMSQTLLQFHTGTNQNLWFGGDNFVPAIGNVNVIETERLSGESWYTLPKPGSTRRPVLELLTLRGYETPELRVSNLQGSYLGGGSISPFEGSFDTDSVSFRYRHVTGAVLWDEKWIGHSDGTGGAVTLPA